MSKKATTCAYCGNRATTRDHIPSRKFFPQPRPDNLITVPACSSCNNGTSADEEYFLLRVLASDGAITPEAAAVSEELFEGILSPRRVRTLASFRSEMHWRPRISPAGVITGRDLEYPLDRNRVRRVMEKILRGLYFHEFGRPVPANHEVVVASYFTRDPIIFEDPTIRGLMANRTEVRGRTVFQYRKQVPRDNPAAVIFIMEFFHGVPAIGAVISKQGADIVKARTSPK